MTRAADGHRDLDRRFGAAIGEDPGHAFVPARGRGRDARSLGAESKVLLFEAEIRTSERTGRQWFSAWLGKARLVGFEDNEPNARGHKVIKFYVEPPMPRPGDGSA